MWNEKNLIALSFYAIAAYALTGCAYTIDQNIKNSKHQITTYAIELFPDREPQIDIQESPEPTGRYYAKNK